MSSRGMERGLTRPRPMQISFTRVKNILTRTSGYLAGVTSHSLQPYRGCTFGNSLCGVGCYVQHNGPLLRGRTWGSFLEVRENAADSYLENFAREAAWARRQRGEFSIFCSSATDPFVPQEKRFGITRGVLEAMLHCPPDLLLLQTHSPAVGEMAGMLQSLQSRCRLRVQVSIESDRDRLPGLPPPAASVARRMEACRQLTEAGIFVVVTVAPLLPIENPDGFFQRIREVAQAVVIDHFIGGDGSESGSRTLRTALPQAMAALDADSVTQNYRERIVEIARQHFPGRVGVHRDGFAGIYS